MPGADRGGVLGVLKHPPPPTMLGLLLGLTVHWIGYGCGIHTGDVARNPVNFIDAESCDLFFWP